MALSTELRAKILQQARDIDRVSDQISANVASNANRSINTQSAQVASRLDNIINSPSVTAASNQRSAQIANRLNTGDVTSYSGGRQAQIVQAAKDYKKSQGGTLMEQATSMNFADSVKPDLTKIMPTAKIAQASFTNPSGKDYYGAEQDRKWYDTVWDTIGAGAGKVNQGAAATLDFAANLLPRLEGELFGATPESTVSGQLLRPVTDATGKLKDYVNETTAGLVENINEDTKDSKAANIAVNLGSDVIAAVPNAVLAYLSAGQSAVAQLGAQSAGVTGTISTAATKMLQNPMFKYSFAQSIGSNFDEAKAAGATDAEAMTAATISSLFNAAIESSGGIEALPDNLRGVDLSTQDKVLSWLSSIPQEGFEEVVQGVVTGLTNKLTFDEGKALYSPTDENAVLNPGRMWQEFGTGAAVAGILGGGQLGANLIGSNINANKDPIGKALEQQKQQNTTQPTGEERVAQAVRDIMGKSEVDEIKIEPSSARVSAEEISEDKPVYNAVDSSNNTILNPPEIVNSQKMEAMGAADSGFDPYSHASLEYGAIEPGENPARVVDVPKSMDGESNVMQTVRTIMEADATPDAVVPELEQAVVDGKFSKMPITDQAAAGRAEGTIKRVGYQQALADWLAEVRSGKVSKDSVAIGETLYNAAANAGDTKSAVKIAVELSTQVRSAAQALQAVRMLKKMSPAAQLYGVKQSVDNLQKTLTEKYGNRAPELVIDEGLAAKFLEAETDADRKTAEEALYKDIAKQIPATFADKWNAWRYLSMLGNAKTHVRNIMGNAMFVPVRFVKNKVGAAMEAGAQAVGLIDKSQRTKAFGAAGKELMRAARADYETVKDQILSSSKYNSSSNIIEQNRQIFEPRAAKLAGAAVKKLTDKDIPKWVENISLEGLRKGNSYLLEAEDSLFSKGAYASSLASYLKAQGFTAADFTGDGMTAQQKDAARAYAIKEAQKATYRDINGFSEAISSIGFKNPGNSKTKKVVNAAVEGNMPFKKTPANILVRGMEYSPAGLAKALFVDSARVAKGKISAGEYMDGLSSGLTGTGLFALGWLMSNAGLLVGGTPEDEDQADLEGRQPYSLEIGGVSIPLDWLAPEAMPIFMGVELAEAIREGGGDASLTDKALSFLYGLSGPMLEMSMMSSLQDALEATEYADNKLLSFMANGALGYLKQALPTVFGQLERSLEGADRQTTFTQDGDKYLNKDAQYMLGSVLNKVPFLDYNQIPYIDAWGRTEDQGDTGTRLFNNMLNPAYASDIQETPVDVEIKRLEQETGENLTPSRAKSTLTIDGKKILLTADEYVAYAKAKGQNDFTFRENLMNSDDYKSLDADTQKQAHKYSADLANALAVQEAGFDDPNMPDWQSELIGADADTITEALIKKSVENRAGVLGGNKYESYGDMLENKTIDDQIAISLLPKGTMDKYLEYGKSVPVSDLMDVLAYKNSDEAKSVTDPATGKTVKGESLQDHIEAYLNEKYKGSVNKQIKIGIWCTLYSESTCPWK